MRKKILFIIFLSVFLSSLAIFLFMNFNSEVALKELIDSYENRILASVERRIKTFHKVLLIIERDLTIKTEKGILNIAKQIEKKGPFAFSPSQLKELALKNGVDEIYLVNKNGVIFNTSFKPDMKFNLFKLSGDFKKFLLSIYGKGKIFTSRIDTSVNTGKINFYSYYSPVGKNYIIEVSIDVKKYINKNYSKDYFDYLFKYFFRYPEDRFVKYVRIYHVNDLKAVTLSKPGRYTFFSEDLLRQLRSGKIVKIKDGKIIKVFKRVNIPEEGFNWVTGKYIEAGFALDFLSAYRKRMIIFSSFIFISVVVLGFFFFSKMVEDQFLEKVFKIKKAINLIAEGNFNYRLDIDDKDELGEIVRNMNKMARELKVLYEELEEKVKERTKELQRRNEELEAMRKKLELLAHIDPLTNLFNRRAMIERVGEEMARARRSGKKFGIIMIDVDDFKHLNDTHGHDFGDKVLKEISRVMKTLLRQQDFIARWGGDEFLIVLPETDLEGTFKVGEKIRKAINNMVFSSNRSEGIRVSVTIGVSSCSGSQTITKCLKEADDALYQGKRAGKNRVVAFSLEN